MPPKFPLPFTRDLMRSFVAQLMQNREMECAMVLALAWAGYLRGKEVLKLRWIDIGLPGDPHLAGISDTTAGVNIKEGKT